MLLKLGYLWKNETGPCHPPCTKLNPIVPDISTALQCQFLVGEKYIRVSFQITIWDVRMKSPSEEIRCSEIDHEQILLIRAFQQRKGRAGRLGVLFIYVHKNIIGSVVWWGCTKRKCRFPRQWYGESQFAFKDEIWGKN